MQAPYNPEGAGFWPEDAVESFDPDTLQAMRSQGPLSEEDVTLAAKELALGWSKLELGTLAVKADCIVDAYYQAKAEKRHATRLLHQQTIAVDAQSPNEQPEMPVHLTEAHVDVYAHALLLALVGQPPEANQRPERGHSDPIAAEQKTPEDIAFRLIKGICVANGGENRNLAQVGLAAMIELPERYR